ncbi:MAG: DinB family protein [Gemmatimonadota bacterium]|jgi:uncharacterized damage-inducible protein DinB
MARHSRLTTLSTLIVLAACSSPPETGEGTTQSGVSDSEATLPDPQGQAMLALLESRIEIAQDKFFQLAEAIPEDRYDWRPMDGVRSFREVFIHVAADNWAPMWADVQTPEDIPVTRDMDSFGAYQDQQLSKEETLAELHRSFEFLLESLDQTRDRLDESMMFGDQEWRIDRMWVALVTHMHEHLGQTIAYARTNEIVPPWSR